MKRSRLERPERIQAAETTPTPLAWTPTKPRVELDKPSRDPINMLVRRPVAEVFKHFCRIERYRYNEALEEIMKRAGVLPPDFGGSDWFATPNSNHVFGGQRPVDSMSTDNLNELKVICKHVRSRAGY